MNPKPYPLARSPAANAFVRFSCRTLAGNYAVEGLSFGPDQEPQEHAQVLDRGIERAVRHLVAAPRVFPRRRLGVEAAVILDGDPLRDAILEFRDGEEGARVHPERSQEVVPDVVHEGLAGGPLRSGAEHRVADVGVLVAGSGFVLERDLIERPERGVEPVPGSAHQVAGQVPGLPGQASGHGCELEDAGARRPGIGVFDLRELRDELGHRIAEPRLFQVDEPQHGHRGDRLGDGADPVQVVGAGGCLPFGIGEPESLRGDRFPADHDPEGGAAAPVLLDDAPDLGRRGGGDFRHRPCRLRLGPGPAGEGGNADRQADGNRAVETWTGETRRRTHDRCERYREARSAGC